MPIVINEPPIDARPPTERPVAVSAPDRAGDPFNVAPRPARTERATSPSERWYGVYSAIVVDNRDPNGLGRVRVSLPWVPDSGEFSGLQKGQTHETWARLATMAAGENRGSWFLPEIHDEVLVSFEAGHPSRPVVIGALWNGVDTPPVTANEQNTIKTLRTRGGSEVRFDDASHSESVEIRTAGGQLIRIGNGAGGMVEIRDNNGNEVVMSTAGVSITSPAKVTVSAAAVSVESGFMELEAGMVRCSGVLQCDTLITQSVVSSSYTPGAGNIW